MVEQISGPSSRLESIAPIEETCCRGDRMSNLVAFIDALIAFRAPNVFNPWGEDDPSDINGGYFGRVVRLKRHLACSPSLLLIGEAPGYAGCKFSGVPFTNEKLLLEGKISRISLTGRITTRPRPWCEPSATIVWGSLHALGLADKVVMWNAFAFHPHKPGLPMSNRAPTREELLAGLPILRGFLGLFPNVPRVAVGKVAERTLGGLGIETLASVRHPSMGGAVQFRDGMQTIALGVA